MTLIPPGDRWLDSIDDTYLPVVGSISGVPDAGKPQRPAIVVAKKNEGVLAVLGTSSPKHYARPLLVIDPTTDATMSAYARILGLSQRQPTYFGHLTVAFAKRRFFSRDVCWSLPDVFVEKLFAAIEDEFVRGWSILNRHVRVADDRSNSEFQDALDLRANAREILGL